MMNEHYPPPPHDGAYLTELVEGVASNRREHDRLIGRVSEHWRPDRLDTVDHLILLIATEELVNDDVPPKVVIAEAVKLAATYGSERSAGFVNGLLDSVAKELGRL